MKSRSVFATTSFLRCLALPDAGRRHPAQYPNVSDVLVRARALEAGLTIAYANSCGQENDLEYGGKSLIVGPDGEILAQAGTGEVLLIVDLATTNTIDPALLSTQHLDFLELN